MFLFNLVLVVFFDFVKLSVGHWGGRTIFVIKLCLNTFCLLLTN